MKYLLNVEGGVAHELVPLPPRPVPLADVIEVHTFVMYPGSIYCGPDETDSHWEHKATSEAALVRAWAEHLATAIEATLEVDHG